MVFFCIISEFLSFFLFFFPSLFAEEGAVLRPWLGLDPKAKEVLQLKKSLALFVARMIQRWGEVAGGEVQQGKVSRTSDQKRVASREPQMETPLAWRSRQSAVACPPHRQILGAFRKWPCAAQIHPRFQWEQPAPWKRRGDGQRQMEGFRGGGGLYSQMKAPSCVSVERPSPLKQSLCSEWLYDT